MKSHVQVAVIGGGVVGCSVLYHLTRAGWKDVVLIERSELTSGSSWHAAGGMHTLNSDPNVAALQQYTIDLYKEIEEISGQSCGVHLSGGVLLADTAERMQWLRSMHALERKRGMETEIISVAEAREIFPLLEEKHFVGAMHESLKGHVDPSGVTHAYAGAARVNGAEIYRQNRVVELVQQADGEWDVITENGTLHAQHVVNAGGLWAREVGRMVGLELPLLAMEHMYLLTDEMPEVTQFNATSGKEMPSATDFGGELYLRQEGKGMLMGTYEQACKPWSPKDTPWDFGHELLAADLDRIAPSLEVGFSHFPAFNNAGIKQVINGPFTFAPDGNPLVGPVRGLKNYWVACAVMAGFSQGGGVGLALANWMTSGDPGFDVWAMDVARYGDWTSMAYTNARVRENYSSRFKIVFPNEHRPAGRPLKTTPVYSRLQEANGVFGAAYGLENALWFAAPGDEPHEQVTFKRSNAFPQVAKECAAVRHSAGMMDISSFAKYDVSGPGAADWLRMMLANRIPRQGRLLLSPMLNDNGKLIGDFTLARLGADRFMIFGSGIAEEYHMRWFESHLPPTGVVLKARGLSLTGLSVAGPKSRAILQKLTDENISGNAFKFMDIRETHLGMIPALVGRISFTGDLGFEIWTAPEYQIPLFDQLMAAGEEFGLRLYGSHALASLRMEKSFGTWAREFRPIYGPFEAGLGPFVKLDKGEFIGREAAQREHDAPLEKKLVTFTVNIEDADVMGDEPIWCGDDIVGAVTSGAYAHHSAVSMAMGYVQSEHTANLAENAFDIQILGHRCPATIIPQALFDPKGERMRG